MTIINVCNLFSPIVDPLIGIINILILMSLITPVKNKQLLYRRRCTELSGVLAHMRVVLIYRGYIYEKKKKMLSFIVHCIFHFIVHFLLEQGTLNVNKVTPNFFVIFNV